MIAIDAGNWALHTNYGTLTWGTMQSNISGFAQALAAFMNDLGPLRSRVTVVTISEFGRRVAENGNQGLDHGWGNMMLVAGAGALFGWVNLQRARAADAAAQKSRGDAEKLRGNALTVPRDALPPLVANVIEPVARSVVEERSGLFLWLNGGRTVEHQPLVAALEFLSLWALAGAYFVLSWRRGGQTVGMRPWRLKVVAADGRPASARALWLRYLVAWLTPVIGLAWCLVDGERRGLHDLASGTVFVRLQAPAAGGAR